MYVPCYFLCIFLSIGIAFGMDVEEKPTFAVLDGIRLAHQFYAKRDLHQKQDPCFSALPSEIQGRITAQAHPRQTVDAYWADDLICVGEKKLPYKIYKFALQHDSLVYFAQEKESLDYVLHHIDLNCFSDNKVTHVAYYGKGVPALALCGSKVVFELHDYHVAIIHKNAINTDSVTKIVHKDGYPLSFYSFACHARLPLCLLMGNNKMLYIYNIETNTRRYSYDTSDLLKGDEPSFLAWHPTEQIYSVSKDQHVFWEDLVDLEDLQDLFSTVSSRNGPHYGKATFSYNGDVIWCQSRELPQKKRTLKWLLLSVNSRSYRQLPRDVAIENALLESVGDEYILTRDNTTHVCSLQSLYDDTKKVIKSLNGLKGKLHKLPDNHDYRLFVIDEVTDPTDTSQISSVIKIFVPNSRACMAHYSLFNAALEAEKTDRALDWNLFKKADPRLLQQTAEHYPYFKKLMIEHRLLQGFKQV